MDDAVLTIRDIKVRAVNAPLKRPIRTAVGAIPSAPLLLIDVGTDQGIVGRSYLFAYTPAALAPLARLAAEISGELTGQPVVPVEHHARLRPPVPAARPPGPARHAAVRPGHGVVGRARPRRRLARRPAARRPAAAAAGL